MNFKNMEILKEGLYKEKLRKNEAHKKQVPQLKNNRKDINKNKIA